MERNRPSRRLWKRAVTAAALVVLVAFAALFLWTRRLSAQAEMEHPDLGRRVEAEGVRLHYVERGSGRPVVFLHGAFGGVQDYTATIFDPASRRWRALAFDFAGHGYSERPSEPMTPATHARLIAIALAKLRVERPVLVGFSFGGTVALAYALERPAEVAGLVLINPVAYPWPGDVDAIYAIAGWPILGPLFTHTLVMPLGRERARASIERAFAPARVPFTFKSSPVTLALRPASFEALSEDMRGLNAFVAAQSERYAEIRVPLVLVVAEGDRIAGPKHHSYHLHEVVAGSELVSIADAGHQVLFTHPREVLAAIERVVAASGG